MQACFKTTRGRLQAPNQVRTYTHHIFQRLPQLVHRQNRVAASSPLRVCASTWSIFLDLHFPQINTPSSRTVSFVSTGTGGLRALDRWSASHGADSPAHIRRMYRP